MATYFYRDSFALSPGLVYLVGHIFFYQKVEAFHLGIDVRDADVVLPTMANGIEQIVRNLQLHVVVEARQVVHHVLIKLVAYSSFDVLKHRFRYTIYGYCARMSRVMIFFLRTGSAFMAFSKIMAKFSINK